MICLPEPKSIVKYEAGMSWVHISTILSFFLENSSENSTKIHGICIEKSKDLFDQNLGKVRDNSGFLNQFYLIKSPGSPFSTDDAFTMTPVTCHLDIFDKSRDSPLVAGSCLVSLPQFVAIHCIIPSPLPFSLYSIEIGTRGRGCSLYNFQFFGGKISVKNIAKLQR